MRFLIPFSFIAASVALLGDEAGIRLESIEYPFEEEVFEFESQGQTLEMVYMDVSPAESDPKGTVLLLHGKNFSGAYFEDTADALVDAGFRVVIPDQIGFGKSSKPEHYQFTFEQLAHNTRELLESVGVEEVQVLGHSMGGMVATRFSLMFPDQVESLTLLNPIGLEDWAAQGVPYITIDQRYEGELAKTAEKIRAYQLESYYDGNWKEEYDPWVELLATFIESPEYPRMAWDQALTGDMVFTQPVVYEFGDLSMPTLLIIGQRDRTALGKNLVSDDVRATLGNYPELGKRTAEAIPDSYLVELDGIGHLPHIEAFDRFIDPYLSFLQGVSEGDSSDQIGEAVSAAVATEE